MEKWLLSLNDLSHPFLSGALDKSKVVFLISTFNMLWPILSNTPPEQVTQGADLERANTMI